MSSSEPPLVVFTVLSQMAVGMIMVFTGITFMSPDNALLCSPLVPGAALGILILGFGAATLHLGHPTGGVRSIVNLRYSWLSREILAFGCCGAVLAVDTGLRWRGYCMPLMLIPASVTGIIAIYTSARVYGPPGYPAINNASPMVFFMITATLLGSGGLIYPPFGSLANVVKPVLLVSLIIGGIVHVTVPSLWMTGGRVQQLTGRAHYRSVTYWTRIIVQFGFSLVVLILLDTIPPWLPLVLLAGELAGRTLFFSHTVHTSVNMGKPY
ncbi:MAG: dimethyl sulfoxide reductase anchor subunit [Desulfobacteraceae bacterium]|nr:dimethyl sulfoxide reductase anchor subunit [Desulfobacteraceae bacterium]